MKAALPLVKKLETASGDSSVAAPYYWSRSPVLALSWVGSTTRHCVSFSSRGRCLLTTVCGWLTMRERVSSGLRAWLIVVAILGLARSRLWGNRARSVTSPRFRSKRTILFMALCWRLNSCKEAGGSNQGLYSLRRRRLISIGIPIINLRRSDRLRFIMGILIPVRRRLLSE